MTKAFKAKLMQYGMVDTRKYRYRIDGDYVLRIALEALNTTCALSLKSGINPFGWEIVETM